jgi:hypothetical protein
VLLYCNFDEFCLFGGKIHKIFDITNMKKKTPIVEGHLLKWDLTSTQKSNKGLMARTMTGETKREGQRKAEKKGESQSVPLVVWTSSQCPCLVFCS